MAEEFGKVTLLAPNTAKWSFGNKLSSGRWISNSFSVLGYSGYLYFLVQPNKTESGSGKLYLYEKIESAPKTCDLLVILRYNSETKEISVKNREGLKLEKWIMYYIAEIKTDYLLEIICIFLKVEIRSETAEQIGDPEIDIETEEDSEVPSLHHQENVLGSYRVPAWLVLGNPEIDIETEEDSEVFKEKEKKLERNEQHKWKGLSDLSEDLKNVFLSQEDSDIILNVGGIKYAAHKVIIKARSSVFRAMLEHDMTEKNEGAVNIPDCDPHIFPDFLLYLYTGQLDDISKENVFQLYYMSDKYDVKELKLNCVDYIVNNLSTDIICDVVALATKHSERDMLEHAIHFFMDNAKAIFVTVQWQEFMKHNYTQANELIIKAFDNDSRK